MTDVKIAHNVIFPFSHIVSIYEAHISVSLPLFSRDSLLVENVFKTELRADK